MAEPAARSARGKEGIKGGYKLTPVMQQYLEIKRGHEDAILFFRLGDFYEMFFEDAERAAPILEVALTTRNRNDEHPIPLCGVPYHSAKPYIRRLIDAGLKVAICEQIELPGAGSGQAAKIARREVTKVITPGTALDEETLAPDCGSYLLAICEHDGLWGAAWADFSTGEVVATEVASRQALADQCASLAPRELVCESQLRKREEAWLAEIGGGVVVNEAVAEEAFSAEAGQADLPAAAARAVDLLRGYIERVQGGHTDHLRAPLYHDAGAHLHVDPASRHNLEVLESYDGSRKGSLLGVVDRSVTAMGKRLVRRWLAEPLADGAAIGERLDGVEYFVERFECRDALRTALRDVGDLERLAGRIGSRNATPRDLAALGTALEGVAAVAACVADPGLPPSLEATVGRLDALPDVRALLARALVDDPPVQLRQGDVIRAGYHDEVDRLREIRRDGKSWIASIESDERRRTGISGLKVGFNKVFGYYLEVGKSASHKVPGDYERRQTLTNAERYVTPALKEREREVLGAEERLASLQAHLFGELVAQVGLHMSSLSASARALAQLDATAGLAETAHRRGYVRPELHRDDALEIVEGRHPVVEDAIGAGFVPNDCRLDSTEQLLIVITGPNMAGKSTYLRQVALIALLAHCGSFVPALSARIPLMDRIFTRIGASDNLSAGKSTFMVEMSETAHILSHMSERSLVVLDEIGRGTSTFDGISIAWAVAEHMIATGVKTLFATHYHELTGLAAEHARVANYCVGVKRYRGEIVFLYRVASGVASGSFGIDVARLAGLPEALVANARLMLERFQGGDRLLGAGPDPQLRLFGSQEPSPDLGSERARDERLAEVARALENAEVEAMTPLEALNLLAGLVGRLRNGR